MDNEDIRESGRQDASVERTPLPESNRNVSDADRAANPFGSAKRERDMARDREGRFAKPKEGEPKPDQGKPDQGDEGGEPEEPEHRQERQQQPGQVPQGALRAEREKRQNLERQIETLSHQLAEQRGMLLARQQPVQEQRPDGAIPDFWADPGARVRHEAQSLVNPLERQLFDQRMFFSERLAVQQHGETTVTGMKQALGELSRSNPRLFQQMEAQAATSMDPVGDLVRWHKQQVAQREIGDDPVAYRERLRQELLRELQAEGGAQEHQQHQQPAAQQPAQRYALPSSFAGAPGGGPRGGPAYVGARPLSEIMPRG